MPRILQLKAAGLVCHILLPIGRNEPSFQTDRTTKEQRAPEATIQKLVVPYTRSRRHLNRCRLKLDDMVLGNVETNAALVLRGKGQGTI